MAAYRASLQPKGIYWAVGDLATLEREVRVHLAKTAQRFEHDATARRPFAVLGEAEVKALSVAGMYEGEITATALSSTLQIMHVTATFHLERLVEAELMESLRSVYEETTYVLTQRGRTELFDRGLLK